MMENLPVEVVTHILKFLPSLKDRKACSLVCRSWYEAYQDPVFRQYESLHITSDNRFHVLNELKNENRKYLNLVLKEIEVSESSFNFWDRFGPNLKSLSLFSCDIREKTFVNILKKCEKLESLCVQNCRELFMVGKLLEDAAERSCLKEKLNSLSTLNLSHNRYLSDAVFIKFILVFPRIKKLILSGCQISFFSGLYKKYYPNGQVALSESVLTFPVILNYIKNNAKSIKFLSFNDTFIDNAAILYFSQIEDLQLNSLHLRSCFQLSHEGMMLLSNHQTSLTELDISLCPRITDNSLLAISSGLTNLISLSLQRCRAITDMGVSALNQLEKLQFLNISECDLIEGEGIIKGICHRINPNFKEIRLSHLRNMTDHVVVSLSKSLPNLRVLDLGFCFNAVTDRSVQSILKNNRYLRTLILTMCDKVTDSGLTGMGLKLIPIKKKVEKEKCRLPLGSKAELQIIRDAKLKQEVQELCENSCDFSGYSLKNLKGLQDLNLSGCNTISDVSLIYAFQLHELRHLNLSHCNQISAEGLKYFTINNRAVESLNFEFCQNIDDEGVSYIVQNLKRLDTLILGSNKMTDSTASLLIQYGTGLTYLDIRHCNQISSNAVDDIIKNLTKLQTFLFSNSKFEDAHIPVPPEPIGLWVTQRN